MLRYLSTALLPVALVLLAPASVNAQWGPPQSSYRGGADIAGRYYYPDLQADEWVYHSGRNYLFVNERGSRATFAYVSPNSLQLVTSDGGWDPDISATVTWDGYGRKMIRFYTPRGPAGYWVQG